MSIVRSPLPFFSALILLSISPNALAQKPLPIVPPSQRVGDVTTRSRDLAKLFDDIWQERLKQNPEYATYLGDKRYDDQLSDLSPRAINDALARHAATSSGSP